MNLPEPTIINVFLAALPILTVLYLMIGRNWGGSKAGLAGWFVATVVALVFFGATLQLLLVAWGKAVLLALFVLYIIWMALLLYNTVNEAGVIDAIGRELPGVANDRPGQALLLAWVFASFLQGATGFGVPAAVVAPLVLGLGFAAETAVAIGLLGHAWAVTFGSLGSSFISLVATTGVPGEVLAGPSAALLAVCCLACGAGVLWLSGGKDALISRWPLLLLLAAVMGGTQWLLAVLGLWTLAAFGAGLVGLVVAIAVLVRGQSFNPRPLLEAFAPYMLLIAVIVLGQVVFGQVLDAVVIDPLFPAVETSFGWATPEETGRSISVFGHAGALLLYASLLIFGWFRWRGPLPPRDGEKARTYSGRTILTKTLKGSIKPTIGVYALVAMALTMQHAGATQLLAEVISDNAGPFFPFISPFIGALGAFMTGSNTNSNVVFGQLQQQTAIALDLAVPLILASQTAGGAMGSVFAPAKVVVGASTVTGADEGRVMKTVTTAGLLVVTILGVITLVASYLL